MPSLFEKIVLRSTLREGWARTHANNGVPGSDGVSIRMLELRLEQELNALEDELRKGTYTPIPLLGVDIPKPDGSKRFLAIPSVRDRVAQSAAFIVLGPIVEREMESCSFAYRPGLSYQDAIRQLGKLRDEGFKWVVDADITSFFDEVDHGLLLNRFSELIPDSQVIDLIKKWISVDVIRKGKLKTRSKGLPQGSVVAPMLANLFLDQFDEALTKEGFRLIRYSDDFVILCKSYHHAESALELTTELLDELHLKIHHGKTHVVSFEQGFRFLGSLFVRSLVIPSKQPIDLIPRSELPEVGANATILGDDSLSKGAIDRTELEYTALGRAFLRALDSEGVTLPDFVSAMTDPSPNTAPAPALALSEEEMPIPDSEVRFQLQPGVVPFFRTLYIQEQGAWLRINQKRFVVTARRDSKHVFLEVPAIKIDQIIIFGHCLITPAALQFCLTTDTPITLLST